MKRIKKERFQNCGYQIKKGGFILTGSIMRCTELNLIGKPKGNLTIIHNPNYNFNINCQYLSYLSEELAKVLGSCSAK